MSTPIDRVWLITGASSGIGRELTLQALAAGESVVALARNTEALATLGESDKLLTLTVDVTDDAAVRSAVSTGVARFGRIDVVANNAGYGLFGATEETSDAEARKIFDTNVFGVLNVLRAVLPILRRQGSGHILQGSSTFGQVAVPGVSLLAASKYAVEGISDALVQELAPLGISVTLVQPSYTATNFFANMQRTADTISDYDPTVRATFEALNALPPSAFSDAGRAAAGIRAALDSDVIPTRIALGSGGASAMRDGLEARLAQIDEYAAITNAVDTPTSN